MNTMLNLRALAAGAVWFLAASVAMTRVASGELLTGAEFRRALAQPIGPVTWSEKPLRAALARLTETQHVAIVLDRRIDPDQKVDIAGRDVSLENFVAALAEKQGAGVCQISSVIYIGPAATTQVLPTVVARERDKAQKLPADAKARLLRATAWSWPRLTTPRELVDQLGADYGVKISGKENVPHDLWPETELPPLSFIEKLSLVLAGFHVTLELSPGGDAVRLVAMPAQASLARRYTPRGDAKMLAEQLATQFPHASIRADGAAVVVEGPWEVHDAVARLLAGERVRPIRPPPAGSKQIYTLTIENKPVGGVMKALGAQLGKTVTFDVQVERRLAQEISLSVKDAALEELLRQVLTPANLKFELEGDTIRVYD